MSRRSVAEVLDAAEAVIADDEIDLSNVNTPAKAKAELLDLVAHLRDQLSCDARDVVEQDPAALDDVLKGLFTAAEASAVLGAKTDEEIATLLEDHVWSHESMLSARGELVAAAVERLRRAKGGAMPKEDDDA